MNARARPYVCPVCRDLPESYFGRLVFPDELPKDSDYWNAVAEGGGSVAADPDPPACNNHKKEDGSVEIVLLIPVISLKENE